MEEVAQGLFLEHTGVSEKGMLWWSKTKTGAMASLELPNKVGAKALGLFLGHQQGARSEDAGTALTGFTCYTTMLPQSANSVT